MKSWEEEEREDRLFVLHNQPLKALHDDGNQCYRLIVIKTELEGLLCYEYNGCGLETHWEDVKELTDTVLKNTTGYIVLPGGLTCLDPREDPLHTGWSQATVFVFTSMLLLHTLSHHESCLLP